MNIFFRFINASSATLLSLCLLYNPQALAATNTLLAPVITFVLEDSETSNNWGAEPLSASDRPQTNWMNIFDGVAVTAITTTLQAALDACPNNQPCVIEVDQLALSDTFFLDRNQTKLIGKVGNKVTFNQSKTGSFFELESNLEEVILEGLNIDGESHDYANDEIVGVFISGENINKVALIDNQIHHLFSDENAHGMAIYGSGSSEASAIQNILIAGNEVHHMHTGSSESIVINGNVKNWQISGNQVHDVNNIAIDAIGGEGTVTPPVAGRVLPHSLDAARYGFIENNTVTNMSTVGNPAYGSIHSYAGGIYIDGAHHIQISNNTVSRSEWAYDIGAENCVSSSHISLTNNTANDSYFGDFIIGGYAAVGFKDNLSINCNPLTSVDADEGHGYVENVTVKNNTFNSPLAAPSGDFVSTILLDNRIRQTVIIHTGIAAEHPDGLASGDQRSIRITE